MKRLALVLAALPMPALAHPGHGEALGFMAGALHPLGGLDHLFTMLAIGLWAGLLGGRARLALPLGFVGGMAGGLALGAAGIALPLVEPAILASVVALGALVAFAARPPLAAAAALAVGFGLLHGFAHGGEAIGAALLPFAAGVLLSTAALHALGVTAMSAEAPRVRYAMRAAAAVLPVAVLALLLG